MVWRFVGLRVEGKGSRLQDLCLQLRVRVSGVIRSPKP